jgi:hypothetical protein
MYNDDHVGQYFVTKCQSAVKMRKPLLRRERELRVVVKMRAERSLRVTA